MEILCFYAGIAMVYLSYSYPIIFLAIVIFFRPCLLFFGCFTIGVCWGIFHQWWVHAGGVPDESVINKAVLQGYVASIPARTHQKTQFQFDVRNLNGKPIKSLVLLSCYDHCPLLKAGQFWQLTAKLKKPRNIQNPGGFDYVSWLNARHIHWSGYTKRNSFTLLERPNPYFLLVWREQLAERLAKLIPDEKPLGILQALTLGITSHIDKEEWDLFRRTGTVHLMVISGAHIGLVAGLVYLLTRRLWGCYSRLCLLYPAQKAASIIAFTAAFIYSLLAGFAVPAQRAVIVCFFMLLRNFCNQRFSAWQAWRYSLCGVLLFEPHSLLMSGFYLSFIAVAILLLANQRFSCTGIKKTLILQVACLLGLMPMTLYWFSYGAVNGLVANLLAIPWVGFVIVPLSLFVLTAQAFVPAWLVWGLHATITILLHYLNIVDSFAALNLNFTFPNVLSPMILMGIMGFSVVTPLRRFLPAILMLAFASFFPQKEKIMPAEARIDILDVGQGLAVVIQTAKHMVLYDTGVKFYQGSDMGKLAIIPYLRTLGINRIDKIIVSHPDLDHRGGLISLEEQYTVGELIVDNPLFYKRGLPCENYPGWTYDDVSFRFFPIKKEIRGKNNHCCVLQVSTSGGQILLPGDIERQAEHYLTQTYGNQLRSSVLLVPHHASKTSSSMAFLKQINPEFAVASYGFDNRYHFPHAQVLENYQKLGIKLFNTVDCGMVSIHLGRNSVQDPVCYSKTAAYL
ncbi:DNA internalization-related competence protein ComEC/Rec2 [Legionella septentrionalis]|nr:DNA internalization-related competence protein ComEC/Rec2 [Legionella septentrionalis]